MRGTYKSLGTCFSSPWSRSIWMERSARGLYECGKCGVQWSKRFRCRFTRKSDIYMGMA